MSRDTILMPEHVCDAKDPDGDPFDRSRYSYDNLATQKWLEGHVSGLKQAVGFLNEKAVELFKSKKISEATTIQALAEEMDRRLEPEMNQRAQDHKKDHPVILGPDEDES